MSRRLEVLVGGQAVWQGVMMRSPQKTVLAVREPAGGIAVRPLAYPSLASSYRVFRWPIFRGIGALWDSLSLGIRAINASIAISSAPEEKITPIQMALSLGLALGLVIVLFFLLPVLLSQLLGLLIPAGYLGLAEGLLRFGIFFLYLWVIALIPEVRKVLFQYHGAEHKVVHAYEHGEELTVANAGKYSTLHPRCSTSFLLVVLMVSFIFFAFLDFPGLLGRLFSRVLFLPLIAGVSFELIRLFALYPDSLLARIIIYPGLLAQKLTTAEPSAEQIEVAIAALKGALEE